MDIFWCKLQSHEKLECNKDITKVRQILRNKYLSFKKEEKGLKFSKGTFLNTVMKYWKTRLEKYHYYSPEP